jgi:hypothetical protein
MCVGAVHRPRAAVTTSARSPPLNLLHMVCAAPGPQSPTLSASFEIAVCPIIDSFPPHPTSRPRAHAKAHYPPVVRFGIKTPPPPPSSVSAATLAPLHRLGGVSHLAPPPHAAGPPGGHRCAPKTRRCLGTPPRRHSSMPPRRTATRVRPHSPHHARPVPRAATVR